MLKRTQRLSFPANEELLLAGDAVAECRRRTLPASREREGGLEFETQNTKHNELRKVALHVSAHFVPFISHL